MNYERFYLQYFNHPLTVVRFAEYHGFTVKKANKVINKGRVIHLDRFGGSL